MKTQGSSGALVVAGLQLKDVRFRSMMTWAECPLRSVNGRANCFVSAQLAGSGDRDEDSERKQTKRSAVITTLGWIGSPGLTLNLVKVRDDTHLGQIEIGRALTEKVCCFLSR